MAVFGPIEIWRSGFSPHSSPVAKKEDFFATRLLWGENSTHPEIQTQITQALKIRQNGVLSHKKIRKKAVKRTKVMLFISPEKSALGNDWHSISWRFVSRKKARDEFSIFLEKA